MRLEGGALARVVALGVLALAGAAALPTKDGNRTLTAVAGIRVGHVTLSERPTGCTAVIAEPAAVGAVDVRGASPGTRETDLLSPLGRVERVNAIVLSGGSAFGLDAASGAVRWLAERGMGLATAAAPVPIVPAAILYDLRLGDAAVRPTAECGYRAAAAATGAPVAEGSLGAGAGATIGKLRGMDRAMKGGLGSAAAQTADGLVVAALVVVNAYGDVVDPGTGEVVAGVRTEDGRRLADARRLLRSEPGWKPPPGENTTLGIVATNARLSKIEAARVAQMAHDGFARAIWPVHTPVDGDTIFTLATGARAGEDDLVVVGALAADVVAEAIVRAARAATSAGGVPALGDLAR